MLYGLGTAATVAPLDAALAALPECFSQELLNCIGRDNANGLPKSQCDTILHGYDNPKDEAPLNDAINSLSICQGPSMVPFVGAALAAGLLIGALVMRR